MGTPLLLDVFNFCYCFFLRLLQAVTYGQYYDVRMTIINKKNLSIVFSVAKRRFRRDIPSAKKPESVAVVAVRCSKSWGCEMCGYIIVYIINIFIIKYIYSGNN